MVDRLIPDSHGSLDTVQVYVQQRSGAQADIQQGRGQQADLNQVYQVLLQVKATMNYINQLEASFDAHKRNMKDQMKHVHDQIHQLSSRLDDHKRHMVNQIKTLGDDLQNYVDMDVGRMVFRIEGAEAKVKTLEDKQGKTSTPM